MSRIIGRGRYAGEVYPEGTAGAAGAATAALRNRNVAIPGALTAPFTPNNSIIAAALFTPRVSGIVQVSASVVVQNDVVGETYAFVLAVTPGTGLTVTGGEATVDGWVVGSNTSPVVGGVTGTPVLGIEDFAVLISGEARQLVAFGISDPLPVGVPAVISVTLGQVGGGHALAQIAILNLSVMELP